MLKTKDKNNICYLCDQDGFKHTKVDNFPNWGFIVQHQDHSTPTLPLEAIYISEVLHQFLSSTLHVPFHWGARALRGGVSEGTEESSGVRSTLDTIFLVQPSSFSHQPPSILLKLYCMHPKDPASYHPTSSLPFLLHIF